MNHVEHRDAWKFGGFERIMLALFLFTISVFVLTLAQAFVVEFGDPEPGFAEHMRLALYVFTGWVVLALGGRPIAAYLYEGALRAKNKVQNNP